ncbi:hypothetical protein [Ruegeria arenilitoris]|uniref:hypothetical protein n=1 Tax=Ruegeria arenilitoris TaxID=1173585 RepID=UPI00147A5112|nr:hypothetical protein [Ruegeria arenilitoris]
MIEKEFSGFHPGHLASTSSREWLPATEAARQLGISAQRLVVAVQKKEIAGKISQRGFGHNQTVVPRFEVLNIAADRRRFTTSCIGWIGKIKSWGRRNSGKSPGLVGEQHRQVF